MMTSLDWIIRQNSMWHIESLINQSRCDWLKGCLCPSQESLHTGQSDSSGDRARSEQDSNQLITWGTMGCTYFREKKIKIHCC